jgi:hypothetical protein
MVIASAFEGNEFTVHQLVAQPRYIGYRFADNINHRCSSTGNRPNRMGNIQKAIHLC